MANAHQTKTVQGTFVERQVTRQEFIREWMDQFHQFFHLAESVKDYDDLQSMKARLEEMAGARWDGLK